MILKLSAPELASLQIIRRPERPRSASYLSAREKAWEKRTAELAARAAKIWNGRVYTVERLLQFDDTRTTLELGVCEYKDIVFRAVHGSEAIARDYGSDHIVTFLTVDCIPVTADGKFVFGLRAAGTSVPEGSLGLIGGTLNQDEMEISSARDFQTFMEHEISEETRLPAQDLSLHCINLFRSKYEFLYRLSLPFGSEELEKYERPGEFSKLLALSADELASSALPKLDAVRFCERYLRELV